MAIERQITIRTNPGGSPRITFDPDPLQARTSDQIFWTNGDSQPHWPGLVKSDGTVDKTFFMPNQIAQGGDTSPVFSTIVTGTLNYACSLHPGETGRIVIA
jgi:plastocyanin